MPYFFNGRLYVSPGAMTRVDDTRMANRNLAIGNIAAVVGLSTGGEPGKALRFGNPTDARAMLRSGPLLDCVLAAFDPSPETPGPSQVFAVRVNPALQASLVLLDAATNQVITLKSTDYGLYTNQMKVKIEAGTTAGKKITTQLGTGYYTEDNIARTVFTIRYSGAAATANMSVTNTTLTLQAPNASTVATIDLNTYDTVQKLTDRINAVSGFAATISQGQQDQPALNALDTVTNQDVKTADYLVTANLQAIVDWFNGAGEGLITATRMANAGAVPVNLPFTYLSGGSDGVTTNTEWQAAFDALKAESLVKWITPATSDASIHAMAQAHVDFMSGAGERERRSICGTALATSDAAAILAARALNSDRVSLVHLGIWDFNADGDLTLYPPYVTAAKIAGMFSGVNPGTPLTNKAIRARGLERKLQRPTDTDALILGGILAIEDTDEGYKVVQSISTWLVDRKFNRVEQSCGVATDFTAQFVRTQLRQIVGQKASPQLAARAIEIARSALRTLSVPEPAGPGILVGDDNSPSFDKLKAEVDGDVVKVEFECSPVIPANYVPTTISIVPYSGTASA